MKKLISLTLSLALALSLSACGEKNAPEDTMANTSSVATEEIKNESPQEELSFENVSSIEDFADRLEEGGYKTTTKENDDGSITIELNAPSAPDKKNPTPTPAPAIPTIDKVTPRPSVKPQPEEEKPTEPQHEPTPEPTPEPQPETEPNPEPEPEPQPEPEPEPQPEPAPKPVSPSKPTYNYTMGQKHTALPITERYLYSTLTAEQKEWYLAIDKAISNLEPSVDLPKKIAESRNYYIYFIYMFDNPEHFYLGNTLTLYRQENKAQILFCYSDGKTYCTYGHTPATITPELKESILAKKAVFDKKVESIVSTIPADAPAVEKERLIYDYILKNSHYNLSARWNGINEDNWNAYGIIVNGYGVCESYSEAFQTLMLRVGINCTGIVGTAGGGHKWNAIELDGEWYACDITFDDPIGSAPDDAYHFYFNLTTAKMIELNHSTEGSDFPGPCCTGTKYEYHSYYGEY
ncbi:MAG: hypothetical protein E7550_05230 [Ruminococcaceae bacterium]|nr:hypothetical protein [Oscillospiraceae bacterium]